MSVRAPVGDLNIAFEKCCIGRGLAAIHGEFSSYTLYLMRSLRLQLDAYNGEGTVFGSISGKALKAIPVALPARSAIEDFERFAKPIDAIIKCNELENRNLAQLRDALLPKLMSGEIDASKVDLTQLNSHLSDWLDCSASYWIVASMRACYSLVSERYTLSSVSPLSFTHSVQPFWLPPSTNVAAVLVL